MSAMRLIVVGLLCCSLAVSCGGEGRTVEVDASVENKRIDAGPAKPLFGVAEPVDDRPLPLEPAGPDGRVLAIAVVGDSIAHGGRFVERFPRTLARLAQAEYPGATVETHAVPGETCGKIADRFDAEVLSRYPPYDTVIIQCGTNDLHNGLETLRVQRVVDRMSRLASRAGMRVIVLTVGPLWGHPGWTEEKEARRVAFNSWVMKHDGLTGVDTASAISTGNPPRIRDAFTHIDHVHPNRDGLDEMARTIWRGALTGGWQSAGPHIRFRLK